MVALFAKHTLGSPVTSFNSYFIVKSSRYIKLIERIATEHLELRRRKQLITLKHVFCHSETVLYPKISKDFKRNIYSKTCGKRNLKGPENFSAESRFPFNQGIL
jgi:cobalamin biosynthesis Co2+ chelatase CbiK